MATFYKDCCGNVLKYIGTNIFERRSLFKVQKNCLRTEYKTCLAYNNRSGPCHKNGQIIALSSLQKKNVDLSVDVIRELKYLKKNK